jgi:uncharacterized repeat protein (TIGR03803 family)
VYYASAFGTNKKISATPTAKEGKPMLSQTRRLISLFRTIILAGLTAVLIPAAVLPMPAQNSVPATASQAARMPQFASRLHPTGRPASQSNPTRARRGSPQGGIIYDNGPINGTVEAWAINFGFVVSDSFTAGQATNVNGMTFGAWLFPGDVLESVEISITSQPNGGTTYFDQTVSFNGSNCFGNQLGYNVCTETSGSFSSPVLQPGTYWVNLQDAVVSNGDPVSWDENNGPSQAYDSSVGTIPSESFTMLGDNGSQCFGSQGKLQVLYNFTQQQAGTHSAAGVTMDRAGNLYGTTENGGNNGAGFAYKLGRFAGWLLDPLFSFSGGNNGDEPAGLIVGQNGSLYGGAQGGIQNCGTDGSQYCGLVFNLRPQPTACPTTQCSWNEKVPYRFSSESDGSGTITVSASDQAGNLYGTTSTGGASDQGTVFELTPSGGGWTKTTLYSFTGGHDGSTPSQILLGNDGDLFGVAEGGLFGDGVVFELTPSGDSWTESVLRAFGKDGVGFPASLVQDGAGNLYGTAINLPVNGPESAALFVLQKTGSGWNYNENPVAHNCSPSDFLYETLNNLTIDAAGNLYGTGGASDGISRNSGRRSPGGGDLCFFNYIFKASYDSNGWHYQDLDFLLNTYFGAGGSLALDTSGNLYGTTDDCGANGYGTVWQLSP